MCCCFQAPSLEEAGDPHLWGWDMWMLWSMAELFAYATGYRAKRSICFPCRHCPPSGSDRMRQGKPAHSISSGEVSIVLCPLLTGDMRQVASALCASVSLTVKPRWRFGDELRKTWVLPPVKWGKGSVLEPNICSFNMIKTMHERMVKVPLNATILVSLFIHPFPSHTLLFTSQGQAVT